MKTTVIALGGNALLPPDAEGFAAQRRTIRESVAQLARLDEERTLVLTHGNGPQVGNLMLEQESLDAADRRPLDVLGAESQAQIGYQLEQEWRSQTGDPAVTTVTQTIVDPDDPAFDDPTKPVGPYYSEAEATTKDFETREVTTADGDVAYRRVVPSPEPIEIVEGEYIETLVDAGATVISVGGGGVPVVPSDGGLEGVEGVIDKDRATQVLATSIDADEFVMLTDVPHASLDFGTEDQRPLRDVDVEMLEEHLDAGQFGVGSMRPKVEAAVEFVERGGDASVITTPDRIHEALRGEAGTIVGSTTGAKMPEAPGGA
jgi:carbamate kinase